MVSIYDLTQKYYGPIIYSATLHGVTLGDLDDIMMPQGNKIFIDAEPEKYNLKYREENFTKIEDEFSLMYSDGPVTYYYNTLHSGCHIGGLIPHRPKEEISMVAAERGLLGITADKFVYIKYAEEHGVSQLSLKLSEAEQVDNLRNEFKHLQILYNNFYKTEMNFNAQIVKSDPKENEYAISLYSYTKAYADMQIIGKKIEFFKKSKITDINLSEIPDLQGSLFVLTPSEQRLSHAIAVGEKDDGSSPFTQATISEIRKAVSNEHCLLFEALKG